MSPSSSTVSSSIYKCEIKYFDHTFKMYEEIKFVAFQYILIRLLFICKNYLFNTSVRVQGRCVQVTLFQSYGIQLGKCTMWISPLTIPTQLMRPPNTHIIQDWAIKILLTQGGRNQRSLVDSNLLRIALESSTLTIAPLNSLLSTVL